MSRTVWWAWVGAWAGVAACAGGATQAPRAAPAKRAEPNYFGAAPSARSAWFREAKFGLFIHWGLYAIPAGEWKGKEIAGIGEWIMNRAKIPVKEYERLAAQFNPTKFNAAEWVRIAKAAGMRYIVITSKHHDGFALFKSAASPYNIVDATPFKRDVLKELADACAKDEYGREHTVSGEGDWRCTTQPGRLYFHLFKWPAGAFEVAGMKGKAKRAHLLADSARAALTVKQDGERLTVALPAKAPDAIASVLCVETE